MASYQFSHSQQEHMRDASTGALGSFDSTEPDIHARLDVLSATYGPFGNMSYPLDANMVDLFLGQDSSIPGSFQEPGQQSQLQQFQDLQPLIKDNRPPWNHVGKTADISGASTGLDHGSQVCYPSADNAITNSHFYREDIASSEYGTLVDSGLSDSGYGSMAKPSIGEPSVFDDADRGLETQSIRSGAGPLHEMQVQDSVSDASHGSIKDSMFSVISDAKYPGTLGYMCRKCSHQVKTKSEMWKHLQRHDKPYRCDVPGCARKEGFGTTNDRDRHKKSVHGGIHGGGQVFRCTKGTCKGKTKDWPRADNFRAHLKRVHHITVAADDDSLNQYVHRPMPLAEDPILSPDSSLSELQGLGSSMTFTPSLDGVFIGDIQTPMSLYPPSQSNVGSVGTEADTVDGGTRERLIDNLDFPSGQETQTNLIRDLLIRPNEFSSAEIPPEDLLLLQHVTGYTDPDATWDECADSEMELGQSGSDELLHLDAFTLSTIPEDPSFSETVQYDRESISRPGSKNDQQHMANTSPDADGDSALDPSLVQTGLGQVSSAPSRYPSAADSAEKPSQKQASGLDTMPSKDVPCPQCKKKFHRRCELRKHLKRHEKPYGCSFPDCNKRFGSKNDWKRHESSQHFQVEVWKCKEPKNDSTDERCDKVFFRRELFKQHLRGFHSYEKTWQINQKTEQCHIGRDCEERFWCNFCHAVVAIKQKGLSAWTERFDHTADHLLPKDASKERSIPATQTPAKRLREVEQGDAEAPPSKRVKPMRMWSCCSCLQPWCVATTVRCLNTDCSHLMCKDCQGEDVESKET